jgi:undecaprenyl-diphosphatase
MKKQNIIILSSLTLALIISFFLDTTIINLVKFLNLGFIEPFFDYPIILLFMIIISVYFIKHLKSKKLALVTWLSPITTFITAAIIKLIIQRPRLSIAKFYPFNIPNYSFPSSHAAVFFSLLPLLIARTKKLRYVWLTYAILVAISRILLKQHYLSDVIAGALLGYGIGILVLYALNKTNFK